VVCVLNSQLDRDIVFIYALFRREKISVVLVLLVTAGKAGRLQMDPPQSISPEFS
jgi:hypothetical protein